MLKIFRKKETKLNKYKYEIIFKNHNASRGELIVKNLDEVYKILCKNDFMQLANKTKAIYFNSNEINTIQIEKVEE